jgi:hypothetical protein
MASEGDKRSVAVSGVPAPSVQLLENLSHPPTHGVRKRGIWKRFFSEPRWAAETGRWGGKWRSVEGAMRPIGLKATEGLLPP